MRVGRSATRTISLASIFARGLAQTARLQRKKMYHRLRCAAQSDSKKVIEEQYLAQALAHNISQQTRKLLFLRNSLHLGTQKFSHGHLTLWRWLCGLFFWCGRTSWLLEWSSSLALLGRSRCRFLCVLAFGDLRFLVLFFFALLLFISIALVSIFTGDRFSCIGLEAVVFCFAAGCSPFNLRFAAGACAAATGPFATISSSFSLHASARYFSTRTQR